MVAAQVRVALQGVGHAGKMLSQRRDVTASVGLGRQRSVRAHGRSLGCSTLRAAHRPGMELLQLKAATPHAHPAPAR